MQYVIEHVGQAGKVGDGRCIGTANHTISAGRSRGDRLKGEDRRFRRLP